MNTAIPVIIMVLKKNKRDTSILFINAGKEFKKGRKQNEMTIEHINKIVETYKKRKIIAKYSDIADKEKIVENDYNLNIPRYVDTWEEEPIPDLKETVQDILKIDDEIKETERKIAPMLRELEGQTPELKKYWSESIQPLIDYFEGGE